MPQPPSVGHVRKKGISAFPQDSRYLFAKCLLFTLIKNQFDIEGLPSWFSSKSYYS